MRMKSVLDPGVMSAGSSPGKCELCIADADYIIVTKHGRPALWLCKNCVGSYINLLRHPVQSSGAVS